MPNIAFTSVLEHNTTQRIHRPVRLNDKQQKAFDLVVEELADGEEANRPYIYTLYKEQGNQPALGILIPKDSVAEGTPESTITNWTNAGEFAPNLKNAKFNAKTMEELKDILMMLIERVKKYPVIQEIEKEFLSNS